MLNGWGILDKYWYKKEGRRPTPAVTTVPVRSAPQNTVLCVYCKTTQQQPKILRCKHLIFYAGVIHCPECSEGTVMGSGMSVDSLDSLQLDNPMDDSADFVDVPLNLKVSTEDLPFLDDFPSAQEVTIDEPEKREDDFIIVDSADVSPDRVRDTLNEEQGTIEAEYFIPFTQRRETCDPLITRWLSKFWFPPSDLKEKRTIEEAAPVYVPFYCFSIRTHSHYTVDIGTTITLPVGTSTKKEMQWKTVEGNFASHYEQITEPASSQVNHKLVAALLRKRGFSSMETKELPPDLVVYEPSKLNEQKIHPVDITYREAFQVMGGVEQVRKWEEKIARSIIKERHAPEDIRNFVCETKMTGFKHFLILLPIFFSGFHYGGKTYEVLISGNKGVVVGDRPFGTGIIGKVFIDALQSVSTMVGESI
ncbi:hypothetical protein PROFUN_15314 [Planoprotostelium fungivorum]|uniref:Uncharacterized protein n=1 Tax=Planoprotostelium fungivorum TaxID=1890364 RepID=A0A2P6MWZ6_9EUKA|nr:hypothetical protein PROFUN_15314 [Planoprotostelium fungivorum]